MLILMGKTASGKNLVRDRLVENCHFSPIITYTTRPMRKDEKQDITYHFISTDEFIEKINNGFFAEWKDYVTNDGIWYYGKRMNPDYISEKIMKKYKEGNCFPCMGERKLQPRINRLNLVA